jgi:hypothetical protein
MTTMNYIGMDVHKNTISYCVKDVSGRVQQASLLPERTFASAAISLAFVLQSRKLSAELGRVAIEVYIAETTSSKAVGNCRELKIPAMVAELARRSDMTVLLRVPAKRPNVHAATERP